MQKAIAAAAVAASLAVGGVAGLVLGTPALAGATGSAGGAVSWVRDALNDLVDDGTITEEQADAVESALDEARPEHGLRGRHGPGLHMNLGAVAEALGMTDDELRAALQDGQTIAEIAGEEGVDVETVVSAIVASLKERLDAKVAGGDLTQEQVDEMLAGAEERATAAVNGGLSRFRGLHHRRT
jgi:hypothetical protein